MTFAAASWEHPISIPVTGIKVENSVPKAIPPIVYVGDRVSTAIRVLQLRPELQLTNEAIERGELQGYPEDTMVISVHGVINQVDYRMVVNTAAKEPRNQNVFFVEFLAFACDCVVETEKTKRGDSIAIIRRAKLLSPTYNQPVSVLCNKEQTTVLRCSLSMTSNAAGEEPMCVSPVLMADGIQKKLNGGKGEPLFEPKDLLIHNAKGDLKKKEAAAKTTTTAAAPVVIGEAPARSGRRRRRRGSRGNGGGKNASVPTTMEKSFERSGVLVG